MNTENEKNLVFFVNGKKITENEPDPEITLLRYLREKLKLTGTKLGCSEGGCGACTVMISKFNRETNKVQHFSANACLMPVCALHGLAVTTVEGIGSTRDRLHPVQERIAKAHGSQCGFCTPGMVMSMYALLRNSSKPSMKELEIAMQGNLCRCTGYRPIIEGYRTFTKEFGNEEVCGMGEKCCKVNGGKLVDDKLFEVSEFVPYNPSQEPIFPPELKLNDQFDKETLKFINDRDVMWFRPIELKELLKFKQEHGTAAKIVVGNTEVGVEVKFKNFDYKFLANPSQIRELNELEVTKDGLKIGAAVTLTEIENFIESKTDQNVIEKSIVEMLHWFAGSQVRNVASIGGNIVTSSPISDLNPILLAAGAKLEVQSLKDGKRIIKMDENFFTGYRKNLIKDNEILVSILIPNTNKNQHFVAYKQAKRREDDIAIVTAAFNFTFKSNTNIIEDAKIAFGGMAQTTILAIKTASLMKGKEWNRKLIEIVNQSLIDEIPLSFDAPGGNVVYRRSLTLSLFFKAFLSISQELDKSLNLNILTDRDRSGIESYQNLTPKSSQLFENVSSDQPLTDPVHRPKIHSSALQQATGEAIYCDDIPKHENELYLSLVLSTKAHAKIISIDASEALKQPGIHAFYSAKDLTKDQNYFMNEELFTSEIATNQGRILGAIVGDNQIKAQRAAKLVKVEYEDLKPVIVTLEDAIKQKSYHENSPTILVNCEIESEFQKAENIFEGKVRLGGQEHFYLETQVALAIPKDSDELEIFSSTQEPAVLQNNAAKLLRLAANKIVCRTKRLGGGFGGKQSRASLAALPVAFAAYKLKRPVRIMFDRDEDMMITGGRNPFLFEYKISFTNEGKMTALEVKAYVNAGYSLESSDLVVYKASSHITNAYNIPKVRFESHVMKTNTPSNNAFRGFGIPEAQMVSEHIIREIANILKKDYIEIMKINLFKTGDVIFYRQLLDDCHSIRCFHEIIQTSNFKERRANVEKFNSENRWKKRGISLTNVMCGVAYGAQFLNQAGVLLHVYLEGSVLVSHGAVEMGQGLNIKILQIVSTTLKLPLERIHIQETATDKVPNAPTTGASVGSDIYGGAVIEACQIILKRLAPYKEKMPNASWDDWIKVAYFDRVSLSTTGFYATPDIGPEINKPRNYFTHGSAVSEVEIDCLTGDHQVNKN
ncbi:hypothetical protein PVAND_009326 [Polypedilum vanderplanki]|uniref:Xanthine dehydrogenase n=1 Tax=Polypedilum vanderplanki TaxID=319348 RepID=A0A9J6CCE3_POLVA|nr:hypothetical protein PVAND_009326 [Polypedilum vanderplanki]